MDDARYFELALLRRLATARGAHLSAADPTVTPGVVLDQLTFIDLIVTLLEELCIEFDGGNEQELVSKLLGEVEHGTPAPALLETSWSAPRRGLRRIVLNGNPRFRVTYRGLRRIDELSDTLRRERVLDDFGILLSTRYLQRDLEEAIQRSPDTSVTVMRADMDNFGPINKKHGHEAGDVVMKAYLEAVRDVVGNIGAAYRGVGDETTIVILGQEHAGAVQVAQALRETVAALRCDSRGVLLPSVSASIGVATSPPENRSRDLLNVADERQRQAKQLGKNRVVSA